MQVTKNFVGSRMNKSVDERLLKDGEYVDGLNIRVSSDESGEAGSVENSKGNEILTALQYNEASLSPDAVCIGAYEDGANEVLYWFVTDPGVVDMIVSYNTNTSTLVYHVISTSVLNFDVNSRVNGINLVDNLLFFTDNLNPPRRINVDSTYPFPSGVTDQVTEEDISVIQAPPLSSPVVTTIQNTTEENYIDDKFISFAYRYRYKDGEYSATSPFSNVAFVPGDFFLDSNSLDNTGMLNATNQANISFNTGTSNVIGIDVLFKETSSNIIKVIERFDKGDESWADDTIQSINFDNRKIYTTLTESELLRLYDNVPITANSQTTIGNRIMYGNYTEGYDVINPAARSPINYTLDVVSESIGVSIIAVTKSDVNWQFLGGTTVSDGRFTIDLSGLELVKGAVLFMNMLIDHAEYGGFSGSDPAAGNENNFLNDFSITLSQDYASVSDFYFSDDFQNSVKGLNPPRLIADCGDGYSLTDQFNCSIGDPPGWVSIDSTNFFTQLNIDEITITPPVITFEENPPGSAITSNEFFKIIAVDASYRVIGNSSSLHSDRDYEIGLVYMDSYGRASTVQVCETNTVFIPKNASPTKNTIKLTINSIAPSWATKYKPVIKSTYGAYQIIYCDTFFRDPFTGTWFLRLIGDNRQKVQEGDLLTVKSDSSGASFSQPKVKVLSVGVKEVNFIADTLFSEPSGLYMELASGPFTVDEDPLSLITYGEFESKCAGPDYINTFPFDLWNDIPFNTYRREVPLSGDDLLATEVKADKFIATASCGLAYPAFINTREAPADPYALVEAAIPAGSKVKFFIEWKRNGDDRFKWVFDKEFSASLTYDNLHDFVIGENIDLTNASNDPDADSQTDTPVAEWDSAIYVDGSYPFPLATTNTEAHVITFQFCQSTAGVWSDPAQLYFSVRTKGGIFKGNAPTLKVRIDIDTLNNYLVFETEPQETDGIVYYENEQSFDIISGYHQGTQNQSAGVPAEIDLNFFDCYTFGNGVESFKIRDELAGMPLTIGTRGHAVANEEYKRAHRFADITYSGVYNEESNINKLNEFNLALVNYKTLDQNYGPIEVMHSRLNDILVLQEDKISYVLANGKNLFSDATAGGAILSTPEVLGQQIPRIEQYGISNNPESFAAYGPNVFFTDSKRNAVINLSGGSTGESLSVISMLGLRSWFRDLFKDNPNTIKLGGYDPYSDEYILSSYGDTPYTLSFSPSVKGWPSFYSFVPEVMIGMNSYLYSFNGGNLYRHNTNETRNNFYGVQYTSKITGVVNEEPSAVKVFKAMSLESNAPWDCTVTSDLSSGYMDSTWFSKKEGDYFAYIRRNANDDNLALRSAQGVGEATAINTAVATAITVSFGFNIDSIASVGDKLYRVVGGGGTNGLLGVITGIAGNTITIDGTTGVTLPLVGSYIFYVKDNVAESYGAIGYYMQYELENSSTGFVELYAVRTELFKSNP